MIIVKLANSSLLLVYQFLFVVYLYLLLENLKYYF